MRTSKVSVFVFLLLLNWACKKEIPNLAPLADAGQSQSLAYGSEVKLNGQASKDPENQALVYKWVFKSKPTGSQAVLAGETTATAQFKADKAGQYTLTLTVTDPLGLASSADVIITIIEAKAPVIKLSVNGSFDLGGILDLDASEAVDPEKRKLSYLWEIVKRPANSTAQLVNPANVIAQFKADYPGEYDVKFTATNDANVSSIFEFSFRVKAIGSAPLANAGKDQTAIVGTRIYVDGSSSTDADKNNLTYSWAFKTLPAGSKAAFINPKAAKTDFVADLIGTYVATLSVSDGIWPAVSKDVTITITALPPPSEIVIGNWAVTSYQTKTNLKSFEATVAEAASNKDLKDTDVVGLAKGLGMIFDKSLKIQVGTNVGIYQFLNMNKSLEISLYDSDTKAYEKTVFELVSLTNTEMRLGFKVLKVVKGQPQIQGLSEILDLIISTIGITVKGTEKDINDASTIQGILVLTKK